MFMIKTSYVLSMKMIRGGALTTVIFGLVFEVRYAIERFVTSALSLLQLTLTVV